MASATTGGIKAGRAFVIIDAVDNTGKMLNTISQRMNQWASRLTGIGRSMMGVGIAASAPMALGVNEYVKFDDLLRQIAAKGPATADEIAAIAEQARELGRTSRHSATDVAGMFLRVIQAGFDPAAAMKMVPNIMDLATAGGSGLETDPGIAAKLVTETMKQFGIAAEDSAGLVTMLNTALNESTYELDDLRDAMSYAGATSADFGISLEETLAGLALLRNFGITGASAGAAWRNMIAMMTDPKAREDFNKQLESMTGKTIEFVNSSNNLNNVTDILLSMGKVMANIGSANVGNLFHELFTVRTTVPANIVAKNQKLLDDLMSKIKFPVKTARQQAQEMDSMIGGAIRVLINNLRDLGLSLGKAMAPAVTKLAGNFTLALQSLSKFIDAHKELVTNTALGLVSIVALGAGLVALGVAIRVATLAFIPFVAASSLIGGTFRMLGAGTHLLSMSFGLLATSMKSLLLLPKMVKGAFVALYGALYGLVWGIQTTIGTLPVIFQTVYTSIYGLIWGIQTTLAAMGWAVAMGPLAAVIVPLIGLFAALAVAVVAVTPELLVAGFTALIGVATSVGDTLRDLWHILTKFGSILLGIVSKIRDLALSLFGLKSAFKSLGEGAGSIFKVVLSDASELKNTIIEMATAISAAFQKGDMEKAWQIGLAGMKVLWLQFVDTIWDAWEEFMIQFASDIRAWKTFFQILDSVTGFKAAREITKGTLDVLDKIVNGNAKPEDVKALEDINASRTKEAAEAREKAAKLEQEAGPVPVFGPAPSLPTTTDNPEEVRRRQALLAEAAALREHADMLEKTAAATSKVLEQMKENVAKAAGVNKEADKARNQAVVDAKKELQEAAASTPSLEPQIPELWKTLANIPPSNDINRQDVVGQMRPLEPEATVIPKFGGPIDATVKGTMEDAREALKVRADQSNAQLETLKEMLKELKAETKEMKEVKNALKNLMEAV